MLRPRRMKERASWVADGVAPLAVAFFNTAGPRPCGTAISPDGADDGAAVNEDGRNDGPPRAATATPPTASVTAITMAPIRRRREGSASFTEWSPSLAGCGNGERARHLPKCPRSPVTRSGNDGRSAAYRHV